MRVREATSEGGSEDSQSEPQLSPRTGAAGAGAGETPAAS